ncbi:MAG: flavin reductase [Muribaculaceae bacterium]|nr:flavin reductase [Muribaculaceae bacterium]
MSFKPKAWLLPQPVLIIGTFNPDGTPNAMNAAWGGQWDANEVFISLGSHATTDNLKNSPYFSLAFATADSLPEADFVGIVSAKKDPDKFAKTGWQTVPSDQTVAPVFDVFPMTMICKVKEKLQESPTGCYLVAEIIDILCDEQFLADDGKPDVSKMNLITFDPIHNKYIQLGKVIGNAFSDGKTLI